MATLLPVAQHRNSSCAAAAFAYSTPSSYDREILQQQQRQQQSKEDAISDDAVLGLETPPSSRRARKDSVDPIINGEREEATTSLADNCGAAQHHPDTAMTTAQVWHCFRNS